ncbi:hypothetical protein [Ferruginibacter albus]|uniref:hypothetical protein n=1 Tax=Ferruginibacter albus TaxID=2875540 RepID=UPI001CC7E022|nr:hypothetical protein [Ferruginibacter albus]UAY51457.1 hypothetical protein K9M53_12770 [Ferruginibacter albus]
MRIILTLFLFCLITTGASAQNVDVAVKYTTKPDLKDNNLIFYDGKQRLTWDDFKGTPNDDNTFTAALTYAGFGYGATFSDDDGDGKGTLTITVYCDFNKNGSWVKEKGRNDYILNHEQHHFDISYICTLLFIKKLKEEKYTLANYNSVIKNAYRQTASQMSSMQNQYDTETHNGLIKDKQEEWNNKIKEQLQTLSSVVQ